MEMKCIKNINEDVWLEFKSLANKNKMTLSKLLEKMIKNYEKDNNNIWNEILNGKKNLSDDEADKMNEIINKERKEKGFRDDISL